MSEAVTVAEASLLARDQRDQAWQQAFVVVLRGELRRDELIHRIGERIDYAPRFRRIVSGWPLPGWIDDPGFSLGGHVRELVLPAGGRLEDVLAEELRQSLPREHPLWRATLVQGVGPGRQAVVVRCHPALVDGYDHVHLLQELFDEEPMPIAGSLPPWQPEQTRPPTLAEAISGLADPVRVLEQAAGGLVGMVENAVRTVTASPRPQHVAGVEVDLSAVAAIRHRFGCTTHDVLVSLATAGVRGWLIDQGRELADPVALVPLAVAEPAVLESAIGCRIAPSWLALPVTAATPGQRLRAVATLTRARIDTGLSVPAVDLIELAGFAAPTVHSVAAGSVVAGRPHTVLVADVPGPDRPRYLGPARVEQVYAAAATTDDEQVTVSITSYLGRVSLGATAVTPLSRWAGDLSEELVALSQEPA